MKNNKCVCNDGYYFLENSDLSAAGIQGICVATKEAEKKIVEKAISDVQKQPKTATATPTPQTKGIDYSKLTSDPSIKVFTPPVTPAKVTTPAVTPKKGIVGKIWDFIKGLFGK